MDRVSRDDDLPPDQLRVASETAASRAATAELLKIPGMLCDVEEAAGHIKSGRFIKWRKVRKDV
jgi:hypothetical protein